jgi:hypothetical protein
MRTIEANFCQSNEQKLLSAIMTQYIVVRQELYLYAGHRLATSLVPVYQIGPCPANAIANASRWEINGY